jgi:hypothetical protein
LKKFPKANASLCHEIVVEPFAASKKMDAGPVELGGQGGNSSLPPDFDGIKAKLVPIY